ncbi:MAG TPA: hypothetical protein VFK70_09990 [Vicinamibacteria bacterium]|nr:hypothetical protein [Vicinamibacteria bacterium]
MSVLLVVDRAPDGSIGAMVWTAAEGDPKLLESRRFLGEAALTIWLSGIATRYGPSNVTINWTSLGSDERLAAAVRSCLATVGG